MSIEAAMNEPVKVHDPWMPEMKGRHTIHPDAKYLTDNYYGGGEICAKYECPHCGKRFEVELPQ